MKQEPNKIVVPIALRASFAADWEKYRILYFCAPCGVGKTAVARALLQGQTVSAFSAFAPDFRLGAACPDCDTVLIDDFQAVDAPADQQTLCRWMNENPDKHFVYLSRSILPGWLIDGANGSSYTIPVGLEGGEGVQYKYVCLVSYGDTAIKSDTAIIEIALDNPAAMVNGAKYLTFNSALAAANQKSSSTVALLRDVAESPSADLTVDKTMTLDLNGCTLDLGNKSLVVNAMKTLTVNDSSSSESGKLTSSAANTLNVSGFLIFNRGAVENTNPAGTAVLASSSQSIYIYGGSFTGSKCLSKTNVNSFFLVYGGKFKSSSNICIDSYNLYIYGGSFESMNGAVGLNLTGTRKYLMGGTYQNGIALTGNSSNTVKSILYSYRYYYDDAESSIYTPPATDTSIGKTVSVRLGYTISYSGMEDAQPGEDYPIVHIKGSNTTVSDPTKIGLYF